MLLERSALHLTDTDVGEMVQIMMSDGTIFEIPVAGFVNDLAPMPSNIYPMAYGYIPFTMLESFGDPLGYNRLYITTTAASTADRSEIEEVVTQVVQAVEEAGYPVLRAEVPEPGKPIMEENMDAVVVLLGIMGTLSLLLSCFLVTNVASAIVGEQIRQIGVIKAIGGRTKQIALLYLQMIFILGLLSLFIAVPMGLVAGYLLAHDMAGEVDFDIVSFGVVPQVLALQVVSAIVVPMIGALFPILSGVRMTVLDAVRGYASPVSVSARGPIGWALAKLERLPVLLILSLRNSVRRRGRLVLTLLALSLGGAMFVTVFSLQLSFPAAMDKIHGEVAAHDVLVDLNQPYPQEELEREAMKVEGVTHAEGWGLADARRVFSKDRTGGSFAIVGLPVTTEVIKPLLAEGHWLQPDEKNTIVMNLDAIKLAREIKVGDEVVLRIGNNVQSWHVVGASIRQNTYEPSAYISYTDFNRITGFEGYANRLVVQSVQHDPVFQSLVESDLLNHFDDIGLQVGHSDTTGNVRQTVDRQIDGLLTMMTAVALLVAVVGVLGLASTMGLNIMDRTRDIGVLRSLGAKDRVIRQIVIMEGLSIGLMSWVFGLILSIPLSLLLGSALMSSLHIPPAGYEFPVSGVLIWLALVMVFSILASWLPARRASRLTVRETLAYEG
jgi:putative ABC transport system permease protein